MSAEVDNLKRALAYLASCHAATLERANDRKSTPQCDIKRFQSIAVTAAAFCRGDFTLLRSSSWRPDGVEGDLKEAEQRCIEAANGQPK